MNLSSIFLYLFWTTISILQIVWVYKLYQKYQFKFLSYYLYLIAMSDLYGFINYNGKSLLNNFFAKNVDILFGNQVITIVAVPLIMMTYYFLLLFLTEIRGGNLPITIKRIYWFFQIAIFISYILLVMQLLKTGKVDPILIYFKLISFSEVVVVSSIYLINAYLTKNLNNRIKKSFIRIFISIDLLSFLGVVLFSDFLTLPLYKSAFVYYTLNSAIYLFSNFVSIGIVTFYVKKYRHIFEIKTTIVSQVRFLTDQYNITNREMEIIQLLIEGKTNNEISETLFISHKTVKNILTNIYKKTAARNRVELTNFFRNSHKKNQNENSLS